MQQSTLGKEVTIQAGDEKLKGILQVPPGAKGIVLFAHGSGSGRLSPRNQFVAQKLQQAKLATLLLDLLTKEEEAIDEKTRQFRFDIDLLAQRLEETTDWLAKQDETKSLRVGYFGASTGAAAALMAAAEMGDVVKAVVSRGGRPDLADDALRDVKAAILLIVGGQDHGVIELNRKAFEEMQATKKMEIVAGATHLFEEAGALDQVAELASKWFSTYLNERT